MLLGVPDFENVWKVVRSVQRVALGMLPAQMQMGSLRFSYACFGVEVARFLVRDSLIRRFFCQVARLKRVEITFSTGSDLKISHH